MQLGATTHHPNFNYMAKKTWKGVNQNKNHNRRKEHISQKYGGMAIRLNKQVKNQSYQSVVPLFFFGRRIIILQFLCYSRNDKIELRIKFILNY